MKVIRTIGFASALLILYMWMFSVSMELGAPDFNTGVLLFGTGLGMHAAIVYHRREERFLYIIFTLLAISAIPLTLNFFPAEPSYQFKLIAWIEFLGLILTRLTAHAHFLKTAPHNEAAVSAPHTTSSASTL